MHARFSNASIPECCPLLPAQCQLRGTLGHCRGKPCVAVSPPPRSDVIFPFPGEVSCGSELAVSHPGLKAELTAAAASFGDLNVGAFARVRYRPAFPSPLRGQTGLGGGVYPSSRRAEWPFVTASVSRWLCAATAAAGRPSQLPGAGSRIPGVTGLTVTVSSLVPKRVTGAGKGRPSPSMRYVFGRLNVFDTW